MTAHSSKRIVKALAVIAAAMWVAPAGAMAPKSFAPGIWRGAGRITGGFSGRGVHVRVTNGTFAFCLYVAPSGRVSATRSRWTIRNFTFTERISAGAHQVTGTGSAHGGGRLSGRTSAVKVKGAQSLTLTLSVDGHRITDSIPLSVSTTMPIATASAHRVTGDVALKGRTAQRHAGFASNERALYVARPVSRCTL